MTKTEAAAIIANDVLVWSRRYDAQITKMLVCERMSEIEVTCHPDTYKGAAVRTGVSYKTVLRLALRMEVY